MDDLRRRAAGALVLVGACWYLPWMLTHLNVHALWLSAPFAAATALLVVSVLLTWVNDWQRSTPPELVVDHGHEPLVAVLVPTCGEPLAMIDATVDSVLTQEWPVERLLVLVGDDAGNAELDTQLQVWRDRHPAARVHLYRAPRRGDPRRCGDAKSGNLNEGLRLLDELDPHDEVAYVETRDADDLVGDPQFLRRVIATLSADPTTAYVQTVKEARVSHGDPFGNNDRLFYRGNMLARNAANAVFPCGSGLVWRRAALADIDGFPTWNLVEDLQSGLEALRRGWRSAYVPIVGAVGQIAPEDIGNLYKQRGTWALDTVRLLVWGDWRGLGLRQRLHFLELGLFYLYSAATLVFFGAPVLGLFLGVYPIVTDSASYALHFWPVTLAIEVFLVVLNPSGRWDDIWRARQMWAGMAPVYLVSAIRAIAYGPRRKPGYRLTRKAHQHRWWWRETLPQMGLSVLLLAAIATDLLRGSVLRDADVGSMYWSAIGVVLLSSFAAKGWFGVLGRRALEPGDAEVEMPVIGAAGAPRLVAAGTTEDAHLVAGTAS